MDFIEGNLEYPDYCVLNLCRIIYSFRERDVAVSKRSSGEWATCQFPQWKTLITAAIRSYEGGKTHADSKLLDGNVVSFLEFARDCVAAAKHELWTRNVAE
jgi:hypothetical protein